MGLKQFQQTCQMHDGLQFYYIRQVTMIEIGQGQEMNEDKVGGCKKRKQVST